MQFISDLPHDLRLHVLSFADIDTKRYAGFKPRPLKTDKISELERLLQERDVEMDKSFCYLKFPSAKENPFVISHYQIPLASDTIIRVQGKVVMRNGSYKAMYHEYEQFKFNQEKRAYEPTLRLSAK